MDLQDVIDNLNVQANAAIKVAQISLEFAMGLAASQNLTLDLRGAAEALEKADLSSIDPGTAEIEMKSRRVAASIIREMDIISRR